MARGDLAKGLRFRPDQSSRQVIVARPEQDYPTAPGSEQLIDLVARFDLRPRQPNIVSGQRGMSLSAFFFSDIAFKLVIQRMGKPIGKPGCSSVAESLF